MLEGVAARGVPGVVSVKADMGVLCRLDDLRSRALALPVPFLDAGAMVEDGLLAWYEGAARASCPHDLSSRGPGVNTKEASQARSGSREWRWRSDCRDMRVVLLFSFSTMGRPVLRVDVWKW